ncbi:MAG: hypothetical protein CME01_03725 [Geminicoccus sp.]|nr:hypothetical protein [Geminicoccus sp.]
MLPGFLNNRSSLIDDGMGADEVIASPFPYPVPLGVCQPTKQVRIAKPTSLFCLLLSDERLQ